jgi:signal recognition particle subunit SRP19
MEGERVLYPCYFNESLTRKEGRRIKKTAAVKNPSVRSILTAAKKIGLEASAEQKSHPGQWLLKEGRVLVKYDKSKEILIKQIAEKLTDN